MGSTRNEYAREWKRRNKDKVRAQSARRYARHRERLCAAGRQWRKDNPEAAHLSDKKSDLRKRYGITLDDYQKRLAEQGGRCAICRNEPDDKYLAVDHCHATGIVRGLLCTRCNAAIGLFHESVASMASAIEYLDSFYSSQGG